MVFTSLQNIFNLLDMFCFTETFLTFLYSSEIHRTILIIPNRSRNISCAFSYKNFSSTYRTYFRTIHLNPDSFWSNAFLLFSKKILERSEIYSAERESWIRKIDPSIRNILLISRWPVSRFLCDLRASGPNRKPKL